MPNPISFPLSIRLFFFFVAWFLDQSSKKVGVDQGIWGPGIWELNPEPEAVAKCVQSIQGYDGQSGKLSFGGKQAVTTRSYRVYDF